MRYAHKPPAKKGKEKYIYRERPIIIINSQQNGPGGGGWFLFFLRGQQHLE